MCEIKEMATLGSRRTSDQRERQLAGKFELIKSHCEVNLAVIGQ